MTNRRRDALKSMFSGEVAAEDVTAGETSAPTGGETPASARPRPSSGAVKAMGLSLARLTGEIDEARALKQDLVRSGGIVDLDPGLIDEAFIADRLSKDDEGDEAFAGLVASMRDNGQQVPVLVRPHPKAEGRYQTAYGHRRIRAAARLGQPVRAIVRELADDELVLAQGKENTERRNLSFIERAMFAKALVDHGFDRSVAIEALSLHKSEMARLLQVADALPPHVARAIGPAPKAGRARWMALADMLKSEAARAKTQDELFSRRFREADSDRRFRLLFDRLSKKPAAARPAEVADEEGRTVARIVAGARPRIDFVGEAAPDFATFVAAELPSLLARFKARQS